MTRRLIFSRQYQTPLHQKVIAVVFCGMICVWALFVVGLVVELADPNSDLSVAVQQIKEARYR